MSHHIGRQAHRSKFSAFTNKQLPGDTQHSGRRFGLRFPHLQDIAALAGHVRVELYVPGAEEAVGHVQALAVQTALKQEETLVSLPCRHHESQSPSLAIQTAQWTATCSCRFRLQCLSCRCLLRAASGSEGGLRVKVLLPLSRQTG